MLEKPVRNQRAKRFRRHGGFMSGDYQTKFSGIARLYGNRSVGPFQTKHIAIVGVGGVGSWTAEALARTGFCKLTLIDLDDICETNINRQIHALIPTVGKQKVEVLAERIASINPDCEVNPISDFLTKNSIDELLGLGFDFVVDAIDSLANKVLLLARCKELGIPTVTVGGAGGRRNPTAVKIDDLSESFNDGLLRQVRKKLRQDYHFPRDRAFDIPSVFSIERPFFPNPDGTVCQNTKDPISYNLDCNTGYGTASFVTGAFGFAAAAVVADHFKVEG